MDCWKTVSAMSDLNLDGYKARINAYRQGTSVGKVKTMKKRILDTFYKTPSFFEVAINDEIREVHIINGYQGENVLLTKPDEKITVGDMVEWHDDTYLCTLVENNKTVQHKGILQRCNGDLKWQDDDGTVHQIPCILVDKTSVYSDGLSKTELMWMGTDQISATVQTNTDTKKIPLNKRFIFTHDANNIYEVTRSDDILVKGLTTLVCKKSLYNNLTDRLDLNLANYNDQVEVEPELPDNALSITGSERLTIWDEDVNYTVNTNQAVKWTLSNNKTLKIESDGNNCIVNPISTSKIGKTTLRVELVEDSSKYVEKIISLYYQ